MKSGHHPWILIFLGLVAFAFWLVIVMTQVQTNEAFVAGTSSVAVYRANWSVLLQIPELVTGNVTSSTEGIQIVVGWGVELLLLVFIVLGYETAHNAVSHRGQIMTAAFGFGSLLIVGFNLWTDYQYGSIGSGIGGHILFSLVNTFFVTFFELLATLLIVTGWKKA